MSLAIAPVGGYLAVTGRWSEPAWPLFAVAAAVATWVAGFDIFYALPDEGFDRGEGLRSAVVRLGESRAILLAKLLHGVTIPGAGALRLRGGLRALVLRGPLWRPRPSWSTSTSLVRPGDLSRLDAAFFTMNGVMCVTVFPFALARPAGRVTPAMPAQPLPSCSRSPAPRARRTASGCSRCWRATRCPVWLDRVEPRHAAARGGVRHRVAGRAAGGHRRRLVVGDRSFPDDDRGALPASGSQRTSGMVICPCSMGTVAAIAAGTSRSLVERAADVTLKERRRLILVPRETPLSLVHLRNLVSVTEAGAVVIPAAPGFYHRPTRVEELVDFIVQRVLDQLGLDIEIARRWTGGR